MTYRAWPAALLAGAALTAAGLVVGEHVVDARDGCLEPAAWFVGTPASAAADAELSDVAGLHADTRIVPTEVSVDLTSDTTDPTDPTDLATGMTDPISGCLDLSRIEIPAPAPAPDGRA